MRHRCAVGYDEEIRITGSGGVANGTTGPAGHRILEIGDLETSRNEFLQARFEHLRFTIGTDGGLADTAIPQPR